MTHDELSRAIEKVVGSTLPDAYRREARQLRARLPGDSVAVQRRLEDMAAEYAERALYTEPVSDLFRCVPAATVQRHMVEPRWRAIDPRAFMAAAEASGEPGAFVRAAIAPGSTVFPMGHSWLIDAPVVMEMDSGELQRSLELRDDQRPPFVVFRLTAARMRTAGVLVRPPNALDAAAAGHPQWSPDGLLLGQEYLDRNIPIEAVEDLLWKP